MGSPALQQLLAIERIRILVVALVVERCKIVAEVVALEVRCKFVWVVVVVEVRCNFASMANCMP